MIRDGLRRPDVFVSAGTIPIMKLMNKTDVGGNKPPLASWLVRIFICGNCYYLSPTSHYYIDLEKARLGEISWHKVLSEARSKVWKNRS